MEYFSAQVQQKDVGGRQQVGQELLLYLGVPGAIPDLEEDVGSLGKTIDALTGWVGSSNYRVSGGGAAGLGTPSPAGPLIPDVRGWPGEPPRGRPVRRNHPGKGKPGDPRDLGRACLSGSEQGTGFPSRPSFSTIVNNDKSSRSPTRGCVIGMRTQCVIFNFF